MPSSETTDPVLLAYREWKAVRKDRDRLLLAQQAADAEIERLRSKLAAPSQPKKRK